MQKIRVPVNQVENYKSFVKLFSRSLEAGTGIRLCGNVLLNTAARAAGHEGHTALLLDSKTYGQGFFLNDELPERMAPGFQKELKQHSIDQDQLVGMLKLSLDAFSDITHEPFLHDENTIAWENIGPIESQSTRHETSIIDVLRNVPEPVIDLPFRVDTTNGSGQVAIAAIANVIRHLNEEQCRTVKFVGRNDALLYLLDHHPDIAGMLKNNPSVQFAQMVSYEEPLPESKPPYNVVIDHGMDEIADAYKSNGGISGISSLPFRADTHGAKTMEIIIENSNSRLILDEPITMGKSKAAAAVLKSLRMTKG